MSARMSIHTFMRKYMHVICTHVHTKIYTHAYTHACTHVTCTHVYTHVYPHAWTHVYTQHEGSQQVLKSCNSGVGCL